MSRAYKRAGVDIDAGNLFVKKIRPMIRTTRRRGVISDIGGFGGFFALDQFSMKEPVLVAGTDGVGTKLKVAIEMGILDTIGIDLVAMCVNDVACSGAEPLFFLDYLATSSLDPDKHSQIVSGIALACKKTKCALIGGETAEMPDMYAGGDFDVAGFALGIVESEKIVDGSDISAGNTIIGLNSSGFHSNGYSLVRNVIKKKRLELGKRYEGLDRPLGEILLEPTILYSPLICKLVRVFQIRGIAHITGGGFIDNIPRILPKGVQAVISRKSWKIPYPFRFIQHHGSIDDEEMLRVFNCGIGMTIVVSSEDADDIAHAIAADGMRASIIGKTKIRPKGAPPIVFE